MYSTKDMKWRVSYQNRCSHAKNMSNKRLLRKEYIDKIIVGSQREGIALPYTSDVDVMQINNSVCCLTDVTGVSLTTEKNVFQVIREEMPPGYCKLKLYHVGHDDRFHDIDYAIITNHETERFLSSSEYIKRNEDFNLNSKTVIGRMTKYGRTQGPSLPKQIVYSDHVNRVRDAEGIPIQIDGDFVKALPCECPDILQRWRERKRPYNWPTPTTVAEVATLPSHVVPVGSKYSPDSDMQWRICYTLAEVYLVQSFGNEQTKAYAILKNIAEYLLPENDLVTSYVIKNIMFWISERIPIQGLTFMKLVKQALTYLQRCIQFKRLRNYMIPERNLFEGNINTTETDAIGIRISCLLHDDSGEIMESVNEYFDSLGKTLYLMERAHQLKVQMLTDVELINVLEYYSTCTNDFTYSLMDKVLDGKYFQRYDLSVLKNPFVILMKPNKAKLYWNTTSNVGLEDVSCMDKCKFVSWIVEGLLYYCLYCWAARTEKVEDRECYLFHRTIYVPAGAGPCSPNLDQDQDQI